MYGERLALKSRLDELNHAEERIIRQFQEERELIYARFRKLDEEERFYSPNGQDELEVTENLNKGNDQEEKIHEFVEQVKMDLKEEVASLIKEFSTQLSEAKEIIQSFSNLQKEQEAIAMTSKEVKRGNQSRRKRNQDFAKLYEEALRYLKLQTASVQSVDIKKVVEGKTGIEIANMTTFMARLMKMYPNIQKPHRGQYLYIEENKESNENENKAENETESGEQELLAENSAVV